MGIKKSTVKWTDEETDILKANWGKMGGKVIELIPTHSPAAVRQKAKDLGLKRTNGRCSRWDADEIEFLRCNAKDMTIRQLSDALSRPMNSVIWKIQTMQLRKKEAV